MTQKHQEHFSTRSVETLGLIGLSVTFKTTLFCFRLIVALYIRHICTITKGSVFPDLSTFTNVIMMTATAVGVGAVAGSSHRGLSALVSRGEETLAVLTFLLPAIEERRAGQGS